MINPALILGIPFLLIIAAAALSSRASREETGSRKQRQFFRHQLRQMILALVGAALLCGCERIPDRVEQFPPQVSARTAATHTNLPPNYHVVCDGAGHFSVMDPDKYILIYHGASTRQQAIEDAWSFYEMEKSYANLPPPPKYDWKLCDE